LTFSLMTFHYDIKTWYTNVSVQVSQMISNRVTFCSPPPKKTKKKKREREIEKMIIKCL
jgi:hypothetical protein